MRQPHPIRQIPLSLVAGFSAVVLLAGTGTAVWTWKTLQSTAPPVQSSLPELESAPDNGATGDAVSNPTQADNSPAPQPTESEVAPAVQQQAQIYWLQDTGTEFVLVPASVDLPENVGGADFEAEALTLAFDQLLQAQPSDELATTIPPDTQLHQVEVRADGIHLDLSQDFTTGGGSASMTGRLGQVLYTATSLDSAAPVWLSVDGEPLELLGGEGLVVIQPLTRQTFEQDFSL